MGIIAAIGGVVMATFIFGLGVLPALLIGVVLLFVLTMYYDKKGEYGSGKPFVITLIALFIIIYICVSIIYK